MNKNKLKLARNKVDQLDQRIFNLIKKRTQAVKYMLSLKKFKKEKLPNAEIIHNYGIYLPNHSLIDKKKNKICM